MDAIEKAEHEIILWSMRCAKDMKIYVGLADAIESRNKAILKLMIEIRYSSVSE
jgi:hypothetical protein